MRIQWWLFVVLGALALELALAWLRPTWLARLAFWPLTGVRRIELPTPSPVLVPESGYRESAARTPALQVPRLDLGRVELGDDAILVASPSGSSFAVKHARLGWARGGYLVHIRAAIEDGALVLRARQAPFPYVTLLILAVLVGVALLARFTRPQLFFVAALALGQVHSWYVARGPRDLAVERAYDAIERALGAAS